MAVTKSAKATSDGRVSAVGGNANTRNVAQLTMERIPTPETGLFDAPIRPAM